MSSQKQRFEALTGIRAIAAYFVFFHHFPPSEKLFGIGFTRFFNQGYCGVLIFFVLSGFLIAYQYRSSQTSKRSWKEFYLRRLARVYPIFFILTVLTLFVRHNRDWNTWIFNLTLLKAYFEEWHGSAVMPAWSLTLEETFYLLFPLILLGFRKTGFLLTLAITYGFGLSLLYLSPHGFFVKHRFLPSFFYFKYFSFFARAFEFYAGVQLFFFLRKTLEKPSFRPSENFPWRTLVGSVGMLWVIYSLSQWGPEGFFSTTGLYYHHFILPVFTSVLFWGLICEKSILQKLLESKVFVFLGKASYSFYLLHLGILTQFYRRRTGLPEPFYFFFVLIVSSLVYQYIEVPIHSWILRKMNKTDSPQKSPLTLPEQEQGLIV